MEVPERPGHRTAARLERSTVSRNLALMQNRGWVTVAEISPAGRVMSVTVVSGPLAGRVAQSKRTVRSRETILLARRLRRWCHGGTGACHEFRDQHHEQMARASAKEEA